MDQWFHMDLKLTCLIINKKLLTPLFFSIKKNQSLARAKFELFSKFFDARANFFVFFFIFGDEKFFFPDPPKKFVENRGYLHTLDHRPLKNVNYFPYIFENVTFGSTKPKKYIFEFLGKKIHEKDQKILKSMVYFFKKSGHHAHIFSPSFSNMYIFHFCDPKVTFSKI